MKVTIKIDMVLSSCYYSCFNQRKNLRMIPVWCVDFEFTIFLDLHHIETLLLVGLLDPMGSTVVELRYSDPTNYMKMME
jgi:hypothetical protein